MNPEEGGRVAKDSQEPLAPTLSKERRLFLNAAAGRLVLTHFDAGRYYIMAKREEAGRIARRIFKKTVVAKDGLRIVV